MKKIKIEVAATSRNRVGQEKSFLTASQILV